VALALGKRTAGAVAAGALLVAALAHLRDPAWLAGVESGFHRWETDAQGTRFRWTTGHASFFVPASSAAIEIPVSAAFDAPQDPYVVATITIDDLAAERVELTDGRWRVVRVPLPRPGSRRLRRVDLRVDRMRPGDRGIRIGEVRVLGSADASQPAARAIGPPGQLDGRAGRAVRRIVEPRPGPFPIAVRVPRSDAIEPHRVQLARAARGRR
jgi:hypothetical protein